MNNGVLWRAGCAETRTSGSESGPEKRTVRNDSNALRSDFYVVVVNGTRMHATGVLDRAAAALTPMGLRLSASKTRTVHIDEGFDFLGWRIQRQRQPGSNKQVVYTWPSKKSLASVKAKVRTITRGSHNQPLASLLRHLNPVLRGWTTYFRHGVSAATFAYLRHFTWRRVVAWLRHKHPRASWKKLRRRYLVEGWWPREGNVTLFNPAAVRTSRYRYRGSRGIPSPWAEQTRRAIT